MDEDDTGGATGEDTGVTDGGDTSLVLRRRALLATGVSGAAALAGCSNNDDGATDSVPGTDPGSDGTGADAGTGSAGTGTAETDGSDDPAADGQVKRGGSILVDQTGYRPADPKLGVVRADAERFAVVDAAGEVVTAGDLSEPIEDDASGDTVRHAAFGDVTEPGIYTLAVGDGVASHRFAVGEGVWGRTLAQLGRRYTLRRANTELADPVTGLDIGPGHPQDAEAELYFGDEFHDEGESIDVSGGWYDAGDYGKYVTPGAITVAQLLLAYERNPDTFEVGQFAVPEGVSTAEREAGMPDLLAEAKHKLEWLARMQRPDGAVYHKVAGTEWPAMDTRPTEDDQTRYVFGLSTYGTGMVAGAAVMAARIYREFDADFADRMLAVAESAFAFLDSNPDPIFRRDEGQNSGSGGYAKETDAEERFWAAAELLKTTGESRYADYLDSTLPELFDRRPPAVSWSNALALGQWAYYSADAGDDDRTATLGENFVAAANAIVDRIESEGYRVALSADEYYWSSAKVAVAKGTLLLLANDIEPREAYVAGALDQVHYVLGRTPTGYSYVTGAGTTTPQNPHSRTVESTGVNVPGNLVGGPNAEGGDPVLDEFIEGESPPPMKCYVDETGSYASNEPAIDYAAPLVVALAEFTPTDAIGVE